MSRWARWRGMGGLADNLVSYGVGGECALVADYGKGDAQGPAEGQGGVVHPARGQGHPSPGLQDPGYGLFGPLGEGSVGLAVVDGAVDV